MSLINKLKNILFEEEEVEIPVLEKKKEEPKIRAEETKKNAAISSFYDDLSPAINTEKKVEEVSKPVNQELNTPVKPRYTEEQVSNNSVTPREFRNEKTFNFPAFDEEEFEKVAPKPRSTNVLEYERKKVEKKQEVKKEIRKPKKKEEIVDNTKFRPSPIISPVYGILDKNYTPDEITSRRASYSDNKTLDVDSVRKKAFGPFEETRFEAPKKVEIPKEEIKEEIKFDDQLFEEKMEKARTIDELLKDSSDEMIPVSEDTLSSLNVPTRETTEEAPRIEALTDVDYEEVPLPTLEDMSYADSKYEDNSEVLEDIEPKHENNLEDDTLESDLFDLIDSMYENREDGE